MGENNTISENAKVPYLFASGAITRTLDKVISAATPGRFTQDFLSTKLGIKGGSARPVIPFLKRTGFLNSDGTPTDLYGEFRSDSLRGNAAAQALKIGYSNLYEMNEYAHDLEDKDLKALIVQATGFAADSSTIKAIQASFKALKSYASFEEPKKPKAPANVCSTENKTKIEKEQTPSAVNERIELRPSNLDLRLGYTINLNLPATTDIVVYNAIFKSLKEHLLDK